MFAFQYYPKHPESGFAYPPGSWELDHSVADIQLVDKARRTKKEGAKLTEAESERLISISGPLIGRALGNPLSLDEDERRSAMGWPSNEECKTNLAAVGLEGLTPEEAVKKAVQDTSWMTREQAHLFMHKFNVRPSTETRRRVPLDKGTAEFLVSTPDEIMAFWSSHVEFQKHLKTDLLLRSAREKEETAKADAELAKDGKDKEVKEEENATPQPEPLMTVEYPEWVNDIVCHKKVFGFVIYKTDEIQPLMEQYIQAETEKWGEAPDIPILESFKRFWKHFLREAVFGPHGEVSHMNQEIDGTHKHVAHSYMMYRTGKIEGPDDAAFRQDFRAEVTRGLRKGFSERYFLLIDKEGFPPIPNVIYSNRLAVPEVWVYDVDWEPPAESGQDSDGYRGRVKVRLFTSWYCVI